MRFLFAYCKASAATSISKFKPYRRYTGKGKWARADARIVNSNGNPLRAMKVVFTWQFDGQTRKIAQHVAARRPRSSTCERSTG